MKFAFSSNAFRGYSLVDTIHILADLGYEGIEIMADTPHAFPPELTDRDFMVISEALQKNKMEVANINAFMLWAIGDTWHPSWIEKDPEQRRKRVEHTRSCIDLAARLGASSISTEPGGPLGGMDEELAVEFFREGLLSIQEHAREKGVRILIEPEPDLLIENSRQFVQFMEGMDREVFGLNFDIGHFYCVGEDPAALVKKLRDDICHFHLEDIASSRVHHHLMPGDGAIDLPDVLRQIDKIGYQDFVTVELYPYEEKPVDAARQALAWLRDLSL
ncbi:MAG: sugar phosphate isomerase/epimerase family protein [Thermodesulfobacteriota bacterium]|nr:sugar phosphate isomerase/epimerase family protein [Thermodesulfobacteriota bacterium]